VLVLSCHRCLLPSAGAVGTSAAAAATKKIAAPAATTTAEVVAEAAAAAEDAVEAFDSVAAVEEDTIEVESVTPMSKMDAAWQMMDEAVRRVKREVDDQREKNNAACRLQTAHNWLDYKTKHVEYDDETMSYFWRAHTLTVLALLISALVYVGVVEEPVEDATYNTRRGAIAALFFWVTLGATIMPDGPFLRPHPAIWRLAFAVSIVYELILIFLLFQVPNIELSPID